MQLLTDFAILSPFFNTVTNVLRAMFHGEESRRSLPKQTRLRMRPKSRIFPFFSEIRDVHV
jgi:hypothetical protein